MTRADEYQTVPLPEKSSDAQLVDELASGDVDSLSELYKRHHNVVFRFARQMTGSPTAAEDVTQEVFLALFRSARHFDARRSTLTTYLYVIARNLVSQQIRRPYIAGIDAVEGDPIEKRPSPLESVLREELIERVREAVLALPPRYREVVVLCDLHERPYTEAAQIIGCKEGTIRSRLHRARAMLARALRDAPRTMRTPASIRCPV